MTKELIPDLPARRADQGGSMYFTVDAAWGVVDFCKQQEVAIIGFEAVVPEGPSLLSLPEHEADFSDLSSTSWAGFVDRTCDAAADALRRWEDQPDVLVTFVMRAPGDQLPWPPGMRGPRRLIPMGVG